MKLGKILRKKRAVSPVVAAILLIGLTVAAGAIVYFIVLPMLEGGTEASDIKIKTASAWADTTGNMSQVKITISNGGEDTVYIDSATVTNGTHSAASVTPDATEIDVGGKTVTFLINGTKSAWTGTVTLTINFHIGDDTADTFSKSIDL